MNKTNGRVFPSEPRSLTMRIHKYQMLLLLSSIWMVSAGIRLMMVPSEIVTTYQFSLWEVLIVFGLVLFITALYGSQRKTQLAK